MKMLSGPKYGLFVSSTFFILILSILSSCSKSSVYDTSNPGPGPGNKGGPGANEVWIQNMAFNPSSITVAAGTTVTWTNKDAITHTVTSDSNLFNSGNITGSSTFSFKFDTAGTYNYHCSIHNSMTGKVIVN
jgi:plastocyanin